MFSSFRQKNNKPKHTNGMQTHISVQVQAQDVAVCQAFLEGIDSVFETIKGFFNLLSNRESMQLDDEYLLNMNEVVIQTLSTFGVTCNNYKSDKKLMSIGTEQVDINWSKLNNDLQENEIVMKYINYMRQALLGKKMKIYPLIQKTQKQKEQDINTVTVNNAMGEMIGGGCRVNKRSKEVIKSYQSFDKEHESMHISQQKKRKSFKRLNNEKKLLKMQQTSPHEMISVFGQNNIQFEQNNYNYNKQNGHGHKHKHKHNHNDRHNGQHSYCCNDEPVNISNSCLIQSLCVNKGQNQMEIKLGTPLLIVKDYGTCKDIRFSAPHSNISLNKVPNKFICNVKNINRIKNAEVSQIMENGYLGYQSLLDSDEEKRLIKQYNAMISACFSGV